MNLAHLTLNTGHLRSSPRAEVTDETLTALLPLIRAGGGPIPGMAGISVQIKRQQPGQAICLVGDDCGTMIMMAAAWEATAAARVWESTLKLAAGAGIPVKGEMPASLPWLAVLLTPSIITLPKASILALGDFERCLAWALIHDTPGQ